jgi:class 3 adenylate cyclase
MPPTPRAGRGRAGDRRDRAGDRADAVRPVWATQSSLVRGRRVAPSPWRTPGLPQLRLTVDNSDAHAEYKQVTVLFADVVHSMDIASVVGAERLREMMAALVDRAAVVVQCSEGTVGGFTGDGIMVVLGGRP